MKNQMLSPDGKAELNILMNQRLADAVDLQMQMKQAHWNVKGPSFIALHEFTREDRSSRQMKLSHNSKTFPHVR